MGYIRTDPKMGQMEIFHPITLNPGSLKGSAVDKVPNVAHNEPYESQSLLLWGKGTRQSLFYILSTSAIRILIIKEKT